MKRLLLTAMLCCCAGPVAAQSFWLSSADVADSAALSSSMPRLAAEVLAVYRDSNRTRFLDHRFRLELLTGKYADAVTTMGELRPARSDTSPAGRARDVALEI